MHPLSFVLLAKSAQLNLLCMILLHYQQNDKDSFSLITCYALLIISKYKLQLEESLT